MVAQGTFLLEAEANRAAELARLAPGDDHSTMVTAPWITAPWITAPWITAPWITGRLRHDPRPPRARARERAATLLLALLLAAAGAVSLRRCRWMRYRISRRCRSS